jgi:hypothetical protein
VIATALTSLGAMREASVSRFEAGMAPGLAPAVTITVSPLGTSLTTPLSHPAIFACAIVGLSKGD